MCGIIAIINKSTCIKEIINGLKQLQNRGYDSAGFCLLNSSFYIKKYASTPECNALVKLENNIDNSFDIGIGIGHTRWATHGAKTDINSHPHISYDGKIALVHNGIIENFDSIRKKLIKKNINFISQTDTEVIVNLLAFEYSKSNDFTKSIKKTIKQLEGTWGLAIINIEEPDRLYCVRHGSPLLVSQNNDMVIVASEQSGFCGLVNNYIILDSNDICIIDRNDNISISTNNKYELREANFDNFDLTPDPYPHWTIKEIEEQYESSLRAISLGGRLLDDNKVILGGLEENKDILLNIDNIILLGCGTSYHAGLVGVNYLKQLCKFNTVQIFDGAEFMKEDIPKLGNTGLILLSQSGETKDLYRCIDIAKDNNLFMIGVINVVDSLIAREVDCGCYLNAGREVGVASTKSFTSQVIILSMIAIWFAQIHNINISKRRKYIKYLRNLPKDIKTSIQISKENKELYNIVNKDNVFILGKSKSEAIAKEGSLKIKELSYIHSEGYSGNSLKHGPFALLDENFPVILINPDDSHYTSMLNAYHEIESRNAPILFITTKKDCDIENSIILPKNDIFGDLLCIIPLQLMAYYLAINKGYNCDMPKNLAKVCTTA